MNYKHSGSLGDIIFALPCILSLNERFASGQPGNLYLQCGVPAAFYPGAVHPAGKVRMNEAMANALIPLLADQPCFGEVALYAGQPIEVDLDLFRATCYPYTAGHIPRWYFYAFQAHYDLTQKWLHVEPNPAFKGRLVVARSSRYQNPHVNYRFLDKHYPVFVGLPEEFTAFKSDCPNAEFAPTQNLKEVAAIIAASKVFVSNQTVAYAISEGLKCLRCLELCLFAPNVVPDGPNAYDFVSQAGAEWCINDALQKSKHAD